MRVQAVSMFFVVALMMVGCQNLEFSGTYSYEEFSKPEVGFGCEFESGTLEFREASKFTLTMDEVGLSEPEKGLFLAREDGSVNLVGSKGLSNSFYTPDTNVIIMPSLMASPGNVGMGWAMKRAEAPRIIDSEFDGICLIISQLDEIEAALLLKTNISFHPVTGSFDMTLSGEFGWSMVAQGTFETLDDGSISLNITTPGLFEGLVFTGDVSEDSSFFLSKSGFTEGSEAMNLILFASKVTEASCALSGSYNVMRFSSFRYGGPGTIQTGTLALNTEPLANFTLQLEDVSTSGIVEMADGASFTLRDDQHGGDLTGLMTNAENNFMVLHNFETMIWPDVELMFAAKVAAQ